MSDTVPAVRVADISHWEGRRVELRGWLYNSRSSGKLRFLQVRDGSGIIQCVVFQGDVSSKVYCFGPTFRAEKSKTRRHLTEFWMIEPEMAYCDLAGDMEVAEGMVAHVVRRVLADCRSDLAALERDLAPLEKILGDEPFPRLSYDEAIESLHGLGSDVEWGSDLGGEDETLLSQQYDRPILVHRYPAAVKAFYMKQDPEDERLALCVDMLAPEGYGEIIGGGQREDDLARLEGRIAAHDLPPEAFAWYVDLRRYGSVPHAGFGMGIERVVAWLCGLKHVRETIPFPRTLQRLYP